MRESLLIPLAIQQAKKSPLEQKHGAVFISHRGEVLGAGFNCFTSRLDFVSSNTPRLSKHAESSAILHIPRNRLLEGSLLVIRLRSSGTLALSKPCRKCLGLLSRRGLTKIIYSTQEGTLSTLYL